MVLAFWLGGGPILIYVLLQVSAIIYKFAPPHWVTKYAPGYSEQAFEKVTLGMSPDEVEKITGKPLSVLYYPSGTEMWSYSYSRKRSIWIARWNWRGVFLSNHVVVKVEKALLFD